MFIINNPHYLNKKRLCKYKHVGYMFDVIVNFFFFLLFSLATKNYYIPKNIFNTS